MAGMEDIKKIAIQFTVAFIVAAIFTSVAPGTATKAFSFFEDKLGFGEPSIGYFSAEPITKTSGTEAEVTYSILGNVNDVEKVLVYHKVAIPPMLGEPDKDGIYSYQGGQITGTYEQKVYYRRSYASMDDFIKGKEQKWEWSLDKKTWTSVETTTTPGNPANPFRKGLGTENKEIINYLNRENPDPKGIGEVYQDTPSLTSNVITSLNDKDGTISTTTSDVDNNAWNQFTIELYISNGNVEIREVVVKIGLPISFAH